MGGREDAVNGIGTVTVTATPAPGYGFSNSELSQEWSFEFTGLPDDCLDLETLALTGGGAATGGVGLAGLLTLGGMLLIVAHRRRVALVQG